MSDQLVVCQITDGYADTAIVHLPAASKHFGNTGQIEFLFNSHKWPPHKWASACGQVEAGYVYNHGGILQQAPVCLDCELALLVEEA